MPLTKLTGVGGIAPCVDGSRKVNSSPSCFFTIIINWSPQCKAGRE